METYVVIGYNSYTSLDTMDEFKILGVFIDEYKANAYSEIYLNNLGREYDKIEIETHISK